MTRQCGSCSLCCRLLPVRELNKAANERCRHQRHTGCAVYQRRSLHQSMAVRALEQAGMMVAMPSACSLWNCRWLSEPEKTAGIGRPDRVGYVLDVVPDFITAIDPETGKATEIEVVQVWVDPKRPDAHKDPELRDYLERLAWDGIVALIRYSDRDAFVLVAPPLNHGEWSELTGAAADRTHSAKEIVEMLARQGKTPELVERLT